MQAGKLRHRITIQQKQTPVSQNTYGEETPTWEDVDTVWAAIEPLRGREFVELQRAGAEITTRIRIRQYDGIEPEMRITWGTHTYDIEAVIPIEERQREIHLMCRELT